MHKFLMASAAAVFALSAAGYADTTATSSVTVTGTVGAKCTLTELSNITLNELTTDASGLHPGGTTNATPVLVGTAMCNGAATNTVTVAATPLINSATTTSTAFIRQIDYTLNVGNLLPGSVTLDTSTTAASMQTVAAFLNTSTGGSILTHATTSPVLAGTYTGTITITLAPG